MLHNVKDDYVSTIRNHTSKFKNNSFRKLAGNDFKNWPGPLEETWRLSRLGTLSRKKLNPIRPNKNKKPNNDLKNKSSQN